MDIDPDEDALRQLAAGGSINFSAWPLLLCDIISRIEKISHTEFPIPNIPPPPKPTPQPEPRFLAPLPSSDPIGPSELNRIGQNQRNSSSVPPTTLPRTTAPTATTATTAEALSPTSSQETNKENANPNPDQAAAVAPTGTATLASGPASSSRGLEDQIQQVAPGELPIQIQQQLTEITSTLTRGFPDHPPHTIQRLAELVLYPRQHYRSLPSYLHAVDRVVHVASGANAFPLSPAVMEPGAMAALANGVPGRLPHNASSSPSTPTPSTFTTQPGLDDHLGGALLTPIPWLTNRPESVDGADAALSPEPDMDDEDGDSSDPLHPSPHSHPQHHAGSGRQRHQQRLSTESTETIQGPNGVGHIETVSVSVNGIVSHGAGTSALAAGLGRGGVGASSRTSPTTSQPQQQQIEGITQGELLREEQRAGVVPVSQAQRSRETVEAQTSNAIVAAAAAESSRSSAPADQGDEEMTDALGEADEADATGGADSEDETPHVRGPEEIGLADTGPQAAGTSIPAAGQTSTSLGVDDIDVEAAVGRRADAKDSSVGSPARTGPDDAALGPEEEAQGLALTPKRSAEGDAASVDEPRAKKLREDSQDGNKLTNDVTEGTEPVSNG